MRLIRACVFAIRSALASVLAALIYIFVLAVVGPLGAGLALQIDVWAQSCAVGTVLPTMPLRLTGDLFVPVEFEATYLETCRQRRLLG